MTDIYGASDDLIEFSGDVSGEVGHSSDEAALIVCSDGTLLTASYGKGDKGIWTIALLEKGRLFNRIDMCVDEHAEIHSDVAYFHPGLKWAYVAKKWERAQ